MKTRIVLIVLALAGSIFWGCVGGPSGKSGAYSTGTQPNPAIYNYDANTSLPRYNPDGSITFIVIGGVEVKLLPMTVRTRGAGAPSMATDAFDALEKQGKAKLADNPQDFDACIILASLYIDRNGSGDADLAIKYINQALGIRKDDSLALYLLGLAYYKKDDKSSRAQALTNLRLALKSNVQNMKGVYYIMGMIHYREERVDEAIEAFEKVNAIDPGFADTTMILETLYSYKK
ncbi:MAG: tetratricopeptide repeat protein [Spirochaetaceae bacterium]|jgi:hypothetical protein|nr:tetratricopeptide repeat protein [Spirochaetaceae bacterium]